MSAITTHVLDISRGRPAAGVPVELERQEEDGTWRAVGRGLTDQDGRLGDLMDEPLRAGVYRLTFDTAAYFAGQDREGFYPEVSVTFQVIRAEEHHHVPILLGPFGYTTYRGS